MSENLETNRNNDEITDPAEALLFIRVIMSSSRGDQKGSGGLASVLDTLFTVAAAVATWWMLSNEIYYVWQLWASHNALLIGLMIFFTLRRGRVSYKDRQILALWVVTMVTLWVSILSLQLFGALKWWGVFPLVTVFVGLGTNAYGIMMWNKFEMALGSLLVLSMPFIIRLREQGYIAALVVIVVFGVVGNVVERIQLKKLQHAA